jgi:hypothetical protein
MRDRPFSEQTSHLSGHTSGSNLVDEISPQSERGWLTILWIFSTLIAMVGWWGSLAWAAAWVVERAFS